MRRLDWTSLKLLPGIKLDFILMQVTIFLVCVQVTGVGYSLRTGLRATWAGVQSFLVGSSTHGLASISHSILEKYILICIYVTDCTGNELWIFSFQPIQFRAMDASWVARSSGPCARSGWIGAVNCREWGQGWEVAYPDSKGEGVQLGVSGS